MKLDEFAFFNQQLAAMLRDGIPLESALGQLCSSMRRGELREELEKLRADLANGIPLKQALAARKLPPFYVQMIQVGVQGNDLPAVLTLIADYYQSGNLIWTRLKGLMVYPILLLAGLLGASVIMGCVLEVMRTASWTSIATCLRANSYRGSRNSILGTVSWYFGRPFSSSRRHFIAVAVMLSLPSMRQRWRWRLPGISRSQSLAVSLGDANHVAGRVHLEPGHLAPPRTRRRFARRR